MEVVIVADARAAGILVADLVEDLLAVAAAPDEAAATSLRLADYYRDVYEQRPPWQRRRTPPGEPAGIAER